MRWNSPCLLLRSIQSNLYLFHFASVNLLIDFKNIEFIYPRVLDSRYFNVITHGNHKIIKANKQEQWDLRIRIGIICNHFFCLAIAMSTLTQGLHQLNKHSTTLNKKKIVNETNVYKYLYAHWLNCTRNFVSNWHIETKMFRPFFCIPACKFLMEFSRGRVFFT